MEASLPQMRSLSSLVQEKREQEPLLPTYQEQSDLLQNSDSEYGPLGLRRLPRRTGWARFLRAALFSGAAVGLLWVISSHVTCILRLARLHHKEDRMASSSFTPRDCVSDAHWSVDPSDPGEGRYRHFALSSFELPVTSDVLHFVSGGDPQYAAGAFSFVADEDIDSEKVVVDIKAKYDDPEAFAETRVCAIRPGDDENGVGIFGPPSDNHPHRRHSQVAFEVRVRLPKQAEGLLYVNSLKTHLPYFLQHFADLRSSVAFGVISLNGAISGITADGLLGEDITAQTSLVPIKGSFVTSNRLDLRTSNAVIDVAATLLNDDDTATATVLKLHTSNAPIEAAIWLNSTSDSATGGAFDVAVHTSNGPLKLAFPYAAPDSLLRLDGASSNAPVRAALHPAFEGAFDLQSSSFFTPTVQTHEVQDPAGRRRTRGISYSAVGKGRVDGKVEWLPRDGDEVHGSVRLRTSNSPVALVL